MPSMFGGKQGHALRRNFAPKMYGPMKNKTVKDNSMEESRPLGQAVSLGRLSSHSRVTTDLKIPFHNSFLPIHLILTVI